MYERSEETNTVKPNMGIWTFIKLEYKLIVGTLILAVILLIFFILTVNGALPVNNTTLAIMGVSGLFAFFGCLLLVMFYRNRNEDSTYDTDETDAVQ